MVDISNCGRRCWLVLASYLRGFGQVMFCDNVLSGLLFVIGIFWGAYVCGTPIMACGAVVGCFVSTLTGYFSEPCKENGIIGLWGFNGVLIGCAFPVFFADTWQMWAMLVFCAMLSVWAREGFDRVLSVFGLSSYTFSFVGITWLVLLSASMIDGLCFLIPDGVDPYVVVDVETIVVGWLKGVSQVFLIDSWQTGVIFFIALLLNNRIATMWVAVASALSMCVSFVAGLPESDIVRGLYSFSPVLTAIAVGCSFDRQTWRSVFLTLTAIVTTVLVQIAMTKLLMPYGVAVLTGSFCVTAWMFMLPKYYRGVDIKE